MSRKFLTRSGALAAGCLALGLITSAIGQQPQAPATGQPGAARQPAASGASVATDKSLRSSELIGLNVKNSQGQDLGEVEDFVIDVKDGRVAYLALSFGGFLGIGDKLFAVPFDQVKFHHGTDETYVMYDISKERLANAPGFDSDNWPDLNDPQWRKRIDDHYRQAARPTDRQ